MRMAFWLVLLVITSAVAIKEEEVRRDDFPLDFVFGSGTSAYQVEGAAFEDGRTASIWDTYAHDGYTHGAGTGDISADEYHKYKEDVQLMKETGLDAYRFSISWSRLIPDGRGKINPAGLEYYNNLINELVNNGIQPHVTLYQFDLPQVLEDEYGGFLSPRIVDDFTAYANVCFREFGDRVSHWITLNEVNAIAFAGYDLAIGPPKRCSYPFGNCSSGNSATEPYIVAHHCLLAHTSAASLYRKQYQAKQNGLIGLNLIVFNLLPETNSTQDSFAAKRTQDFLTGWIVEPLVHGRYPETMRKAAGNKMPRFSSNQAKQLAASFDFIGVNYYFSFHVKDSPNNIPANRRDLFADMESTIEFLSSGVMPTSNESGDTALNASGLQGVLEYFKHNYGNPPIYIHENGLVTRHDMGIDDPLRVKYMTEHLASLRDALRNGSNTKGYFSWSFLDVFELFGGYDASYGIYYVDFNDPERKRYPKLSARWYSNFLRKRSNDICANNISSYASRELSYALK